MIRKNVKIGKNTFTLTELSGGHYSIGYRSWKKEYDKNHFIIKSVNSTFSYNGFSNAHTPIVIDEIEYKERISVDRKIRVLDCPIKFPGSLEYRIPRELIQFEEMISKVVAFEHSINTNVRDYYAYITVDQDPVDPFKYQRSPGCHVDGFQGANIEDKKPVSRSYILYDCIPTVFYPQSFRTDYLNPITDNFFLAFDEQGDENLETTYDPFSIILMNAYTVHRSEMSSKRTNRTFVRITYDTIRFNRLGNTKNLAFGYNWPMNTNSILDKLQHKSLPKYPVNAY